MQSARRQNGNDIYIGPAEKIRDAVKARNRIPAGKLICALRSFVTNGSQHGTLDVPTAKQIGVTLGYAPTAKQANPNHACKIPSQLTEADLD
jgi:hypothetical protein